MRCHARCRKCRTRRVLKARPETYLQLPKCSHCGSRDLVADKWMNERDTKAMTCHADCRHFPHRLGSLGCKYETNGVYRDGQITELTGIELPF